MGAESRQDMNQDPYQPYNNQQPQDWPPQPQSLPQNTQWGQQPYPTQYAQPEYYAQSGTYYQPSASTMPQQGQWQQPTDWQPIPIPPPPPPEKRPRTPPLVVALLLILMAFALVGLATTIFGGGSSPTTGTWTTTQNFTGNGMQSTSYFSVSNDWKIIWTCDPSSFLGNSYNVQVYVYGNVQGVAINTICQAGNTSGETEEHAGGQIYLTINSEAAWTVQIQELE